MKVVISKTNNKIPALIASVVMLTSNVGFSVLTPLNETELNSWLSYIWEGLKLGALFVVTILTTLVVTYGATIASIKVVKMISVAIKDLVKSFGELGKIIRI